VPLVDRLGGEEEGVFVSHLLFLIKLEKGAGERRSKISNRAREKKAQTSKCCRCDGQGFPCRLPSLFFFARAMRERVPLEVLRAREGRGNAREGRRMGTARVCEEEGDRLLLLLRRQTLTGQRPFSFQAPRLPPRPSALLENASR
jgi:hypothetical protein